MADLTLRDRCPSCRAPLLYVWDQDGWRCERENRLFSTREIAAQEPDPTPIHTLSIAVERMLNARRRG